jgi:quercetin dioxygenase-like cupin family protein
MKLKSSVLLLAFAAVCASCATSRVAAQDQPIAAPATQAKFSAIPTAPKCFTIAVEKGDPTKEASVILARFAPGCVAPFHWHTPSETVMIVSGALQVQMKGDKAMIAHRGDFLYMPPRHPHRATCSGTAPCLVFLTSDAAFDVHWIDDAGKEITLEAAMQKVKPAKKSE